MGIFLVKPEARVARIGLIAALVRALESFHFVRPFLLRKFGIFTIQFISALISCEVIVLVINIVLMMFRILLAQSYIFILNWLLLVMICIIL